MTEKLIEARNAFLRHEFLEALELYQQEIDIEPNSCEAYLGAAKCYSMTKKYMEAIAMCNTIMELDPDFVMARVIKAEALELMGKISESRAEINSAYVRSPTNPSVLASYGIMLFHDGRWDEGIKLLEEALTQDPKMYLGYYNLGVMYEKRRNTEKILWCMGKMYEILPSTKNRIRLTIAKINHKKVFRPIMICMALLLLATMVFRVWWLFILSITILLGLLLALTVLRFYLRTP